MRVLIPTLLPLMLCAAARAQEASAIAYEFEPGSNTPLNYMESWQTTDLNADTFTHFSIRVKGDASFDLSNKFVIVFAHMYPEAEGSQEGAAAVAGIAEIHPWMQPVSELTGSLDPLPGDYVLDSASAATLEVPLDRVNTFLATALNSSNPEQYGLNPTNGKVLLEPNTFFGNDPADERACYSLPNMWLSYQDTENDITYGVANLRQMACDTFAQSQYIYNPGATAQTLLDLGIFSETWLKTNIVLQVAIVDKVATGGQKKVKILVPVRIHKRSIATASPDPDSVPLIVPTALGHKVHVMVEGNHTTIPLVQNTLGSRLVFIRLDNHQDPYLVINQIDTLATSNPKFLLPDNFVSIVTNGSVKAPLACVLASDNSPLQPMWLYQDTMMAISTYPHKY